MSRQICLHLVRIWGPNRQNNLSSNQIVLFSTSQTRFDLTSRFRVGSDPKSLLHEKVFGLKSMFPVVLVIQIDFKLT